MSQSPFAPPELAKQRWQFSIRGMLIFTVSVAVGASVSQIDVSHWLTIFVVEKTNYRQHVEVVKTGWGGGMLAAAIFWLCIGLIYQVRDLHACLRANPTLDRGRKAGAKFEMFWRIGLVAGLVVYALVLFLVNMRVVSFPEAGDHVWKMGSMLREATLLSLLLILVGSVPSFRRFKLPGFLMHAIEGVFWGLAIYYLSKTVVYVLVNIATIGIDNEFPARFALIDPRQYARVIVIMSRWSLISMAIALANLFFLRRLARQWPAGGGRRLFWLALLVLGIAENAAFSVWFTSVGYPTISPYLVETGGQVTGNSWVALAILTAVLSAVPAYRMSAERCPATETPAITWRRNPQKYYHERRLILLLFAAALVWILADILLEAWSNPSCPITDLGNLFFNRRWIRTYYDLIEQVYMFLMPVLFLWLGLLLLTLQRAFSRRFDPQSPRADILGINRAKLFVLWLVTAAIMVFGTLTLVWTSYGIWLNPWLNGR